MDFFLLLALGATGAYVLNHQQQRQRIALLARHLHPYQIERLMEQLTQGYLRAMGEQGDERRQQVLSLLAESETQLVAQFDRFVDDFRRVPTALARVSRLPLGLPFATQLLPAATFDMRELLAIHAAGMGRALRNEGNLAARERAFTMTAELLLMQHSCHWFCRSLALASARLQAKHNTPYRQVVASVSQATRQAYTRLTSFPL